MNGIQDRRTRNTDKPVPGCLGRVVNFFDLSTGVAGNRLLTDKQHFDGFGHSRRQPDAMRISPIGDELDDEVASGLTKSSSNRNINGTSVKMLIAEEMSKEVELEHSSPNLVAKLMGLDSLPQRRPDSGAKRSHSRSYSGSNIGMGLDSWQQGKLSQEHNRNKEFPDMTWKSRKGRNMREQLPGKERFCEASDEKKMAIVRQKFVEAKSLATNEKLRQSKKYQETLDVLSSNKGLFLKLLEEPNSYSQNKRITVLRPSMLLDDNQISMSGKMTVKPSKNALHTGQVNRLDKRDHNFSSPSSHPNGNPTPSTRIVVLKPIDKPHVSPSPSPPREYGEEMFSVFSNGYSGDESSFHKSENEFNLGNLSDSEVVTPRSRHMWDYIHRFESPYGSSSFSHASCSPDSSVCKEAKKRLSERWASMSSNGNCQEQRHLWKNSSTLGEMLALSDTKKGVISEEKDTIEEKETRESPICSTSNLNIEQFANDSPRKLSRSNSVPASSAVDTLNRVLDAKVGEADICKETAKINTPKLSFKEKFSSLFFSRYKKTNKDKSPSPQSKYELERPVTLLVQSPEKVSEGISKCSRVMDEEHSPGNSIAQDQIGMERKHGVISPEANLCVTNPSAPRILGENQDQPSPVSVLEPHFEEDESITTDSTNVDGVKYGSELVAHSVNFTLVNKFSPIESIARTLSWDDPCVETATSYPLKPSRVSQGLEEEEQQLLFFVKSLLSAAGFEDEVAPNSLFARWHSPESPLDPSLRDNFIEMNARDIKHEAKRMHTRLVGKLAFDCVNTALVEIIDYGLAKRRCGVHGNALKCSTSSLLVDKVLAYVKEWFSCEVPEEFLGDDVDSSSLVVEAMVRKELVGTNIEAVLIESDNVGKDIEAILLEELMQELVVDFSGRI